MITRRQAALTLGATLTSFAAGRDTRDRIRLYRIPNGGIQPQLALDDRGTLHLVYYTGDAHHGDLLYARSKDGGATFSPAVPVNNSGSAIAAGTIRGAQIALGRAGRVHVAWNGSNNAGPLNPDSGKPGPPMLYSRLKDSGSGFEPERNLMLRSFGLDGGGSIAADKNGSVYVAWHGIGEAEAKGTGKEGEARRRVWITKSDDNGKTFSTETKAWVQETGACGCCGMKIFAGRDGDVLALYRSATESVHRDIYLLSSKDRGRTFQGSLLHKWNINACPMSSMDIKGDANTVFAAWEMGGQVYWTRITGGTAGDPIAAPGEAKGRKHPRLAVNDRGEVLLVWTEGTGWQKGGSFAYQLYDKAGMPTAWTKQLPGIPTWSFAAVVAATDGSFSILY
ncbi:MAG TPA: sialidase family protein [Bryobacteraceae bacterium]|nr:sialidase family protein [Bryobacteraceae bacterium]